MGDDTKYGLIVCGAVMILLGAVFAVGLAILDYGFRCDDRACVHEGLATVQLIVALAGLVPAGLAVLGAFVDRRRMVAISLGITVLTYLWWGVLNDASVHGWDNLQVF